MSVTIKRIGKGKVRVSTPGGVKAKSTTVEKAIHLRNLLNAVEHSDWRPTGKKSSKPAKPNF